MYTTKKGGMIMKLSNMSKMSGFTLAEVLITLGIIGVVAAMTMPTLINSTQGAQYKAAYKKALSALSQAVTLNVALDDWDFGELNGAAGEADYTLLKLLKDRMNVVRYEANKALTSDEYPLNTATTDSHGVKLPGATNTTVFFNDGIMFTYTTASAKTCTLDDTITGNAVCKGFIDVNGTKGPNKVTLCDTETATGGDKGITSCKVTNPADIYPVVFYDTSVLPGTQAAKAVLYGK